MKRMRFFSAISLMILCICILGAGVYAANTTDRNMGMTGTIGIPANLIGVDVAGYIGKVSLDTATGTVTRGETDVTNTPDYSSVYSDEGDARKWTFTDEQMKKLVFNVGEANTIDDVKETITISFVLTNSSGFDLSIYFKNSAGNAVVVESLDGNAKDGDTVINQSIVNVYLGSGTLGKGSDANKTRTLVTMEFGLNKLLHEGDTFDFNYTLVVEEAELIQTPYTELINKVKKLEDLSVAYNTANSLSTDAQLRAMQYIRATSYSDSQWNEIAGTVEPGFATYVAEEGVSSLQTIESIEIPSLVQDVDFVHMIATLNVCVKNSEQESAAQVLAQDFAGWGGDLCQLAINVKEALNGSTDAELIKSKARELFMSSSSGFGAADLFADIDAINLYTTYVAQQTKSLSEAMTTYYSSDLSTRKSAFATTTGLNGKTAAEIVTRLSSNPSIASWCSSQTGTTIGFTDATDVAIFNAVASVFADYLAN